MINIGLERFIYTWHFPKGKKTIDVKAKKGDKVIIKLNTGKVITGVISEIGTKNLRLRAGITLEGKRTTWFLNCRQIKIGDIVDFATYPKGSQRYRCVKLY